MFNVVPEIFFVYILLVNSDSVLVVSLPLLFPSSGLFSFCHSRPAYISISESVNFFENFFSSHEYRELVTLDFMGCITLISSLWQRSSLLATFHPFGLQVYVGLAIRFRACPIHKKEDTTFVVAVGMRGP